MATCNTQNGGCVAQGSPLELVKKLEILPVGNSALKYHAIWGSI